MLRVGEGLAPVGLADMRLGGEGDVHAMMRRYLQSMNGWANAPAVSSGLAVICLALYGVTGAGPWLSVALGSLAFAGFAFWSSANGPAHSERRKSWQQSDDAAMSLAQVSPAALLGALPDAAVVLRAEGTILAANEVAREVLQLNPGLNLHTVMRSPDLAAAFARTLSETTLSVAEVRTGVPVERKLSARLVPLAPQRGPVENLLISFRDRTSEAQLDQMRSDFVANASHELRTPLASLKGFIETLQGAAKDDPAARTQFLDIMQHEANRMSRLIDDLLSLSRIEMRVHVPPSDEVDLRSVVQEIADLLRPSAERLSRTLNVTMPEGPVRVRGERDELIQVVQNLVQNGIKYGRAGGKVDLRLEVVGTLANIVVEDDGIGIAKEDIPRLTERFYRVSAKDSRERGGTGLGLAIVKHIVNRHRGRLDFVSSLGLGTTVTVSLPIIFH